MISFIPRPTLEHLNQLIKIFPDDWHKFGVEYKSVTKNSAGFVTSGQLHDGRRFHFNELKKQFTFSSK